MPDPGAQRASLGFHPPPDPAVLKRSLVLSASASFFGAAFFYVVMGATFQFYLEDFGLKERLNYFLALTCLGGLGQLAGSYLLNNWPRRKLIFFLFAGGTRLLWIPIGLLPLWLDGPERTEHAFWILTVLVPLFHVLHAVCVPAWLSWMGDLVPKHLTGRYWALRQMGTSTFSTLTGFAAGYYLELHRSPRAYAVLIGVSVVLGVIDALLFIPVFHRNRPPLAERPKLLRAFMARLHEHGFRTLCLIYVLLTISIQIVNATVYFLCRDVVGLGPAALNNIYVLSPICMVLFSVVWGRFADGHGYRGPLVLCLLLQAVALLFYLPAGTAGTPWVAAAVIVAAVGFCGSNLLMIPLLLRYSRNAQTGADVGIAAFNAALSAATCAALLLTDRYLYAGLGALLSEPSYSRPVYLAIFALMFLLRLAAAALAWTLPAEDGEAAPGLFLRRLVRANPLRASLGFIQYVAGLTWRRTKNEAPPPNRSTDQQN